MDHFSEFYEGFSSFSIFGMYSNRKVSSDNIKLDMISERNRKLQAFAKSVGCLSPHVVATH